MHVGMFNRQSIKTPGKTRNNFSDAEDAVGSLDPGFEDLGSSVHDIKLAPGLMAHFDGTQVPSGEFMFRTGYQTVGYHQPGTLERIG